MKQENSTLGVEVQKHYLSALCLLDTIKDSQKYAPTNKIHDTKRRAIRIVELYL